MYLRYLLPSGGLLLTFFALRGIGPSADQPDFNLTGATAWAPSRTDIVHTLGRAGESDYRDGRHIRFARMFQKRYRDHQLAVGLKFTAPGKLKLMCAAMVPRWQMADIAVQAHEDARATFGASYSVDIYETYICIRQRRIGEARYDTGARRILVRFAPAVPPGTLPALNQAAAAAAGEFL